LEVLKGAIMIYIDSLQRKEAEDTPREVPESLIIIS
jgi:hypothetical protein